MKILITGGAGFIGTNFVYYMLQKYMEYELVCVDALTYAGNISYLKDAMNCSRFRFYQQNICCRNAIYKLFEAERPDVVINFAAESHVDRSILNPELFVDTNVKGTTVLMDACLKYGVRRFHQVSTDEVYGELPLNRPELLFSEESQIAPSSPYSASKTAADMLVQAYHRTYDLSVSISRCSNNYGSYQHTEKLIPKMINRALHNKTLPIYGNGMNVRDWIYVEDHCSAIDLILHNGESGQVYNIGGNCELCNIDLVKMICKKLGKSEKLIQYVEDRKGHDLRYAIDSHKIQKELGWRPKINFEEGLEKTICWYANRVE